VNLWQTAERDKQRSRSERHPDSREERQAQVNERIASVEAIKATVIRRVLTLDFVMPDSKRLAEWTFAEVGKLGREFAKIAKLGQPHELVGAVLKTDRRLREAIKA
jgi:hypothetical protein